MAAILLQEHHLGAANIVGMIWYSQNVMDVREWLKDLSRPYIAFSLAQWSRLCSLYLRLCMFVLGLYTFGCKQFRKAVFLVKHADFSL